MLRRGDELLVVATDPVRDAAEQRLRAVGQGGKLAGWLGTDGAAGRRAAAPLTSGGTGEARRCGAISTDLKACA